MKSKIVLFVGVFAAAFAGCSNQENQLEKAKAEADSKAQAEAAKTEMKELPEKFRNRDYLKKNEPVAPQKEPEKGELQK